MAGRGGPGDGRGALRAMLGEARYGEAARRFAERCRAFDPAQQRRAMFGRACELLGAGEVEVEPPGVAAVA